MRSGQFVKQVEGYTAFIPAPVSEMHKALNNLEKFLHDSDSFPTLILCSLAHAQFETIHPFLDGNGRIGRLLIIFLTLEKGKSFDTFSFLTFVAKLPNSTF